MEYHPVANVFPLIQGEEYQSLKTDIFINGLLEPIWLAPDGRILDGRNRWRACIDTGIEPRFRNYEGDDTTTAMIRFVFSLNKERRHLTSSQMAAAAIKAEEIMTALEQEAKERQATSESGVYGGKPLKEKIPEAVQGQSRDAAAELFNTNGRYISDAKRLKEQAPEIFEKVASGELTIPKAKQEIARQRVNDPAIAPPLPPNKYRCIVIDPPWPIKKIEREERPNQGAELDYPTMTLEEIAALPVETMAADECHLYVWVTQKYLPAGMDLVKQWGFNYQCLMTWRKNVGFTPFSWMYDTEHVIFAHRGGLRLEQLGLRLSFDAPVTVHSEKPDVFYDERVIPASPGPRLDMFARKQREGFDAWGNEV